jgi:outer membrane protein OmpA-like peptidoglycan-associated protein
MKWKRQTLFVAIALSASLGFSQSDGGTNAGANAGANASVNAPISITMPAGETPHQLIQAAPGPIPGMIPGNALGPGACFLYHPKEKNLTFLSPNAIDAMAKGEKLPHGVKPTTIDPDAAKAAPYNGPVGVMEYDPMGDNINPGDLVLAGIVTPGKYSDINEKLLGKAAKELRKIAPSMQRIAMAGCYIFDEVTDTHSKGVGFSSSGTSGSGQVGNGFSLGWFHGKSSTGQERHVVAYVYAMNGPYNLLEPPKPKEEPPGKQAEAAPPKSQPQPASPVQTIRVQVELVPPKPQVVSAPAVSTNPYLLPEFAAYFDFGKSNIKSEYLSELDKMVAWLKSHPDCNVVIEGHTDKSGGVVYNDGLGARRSHEVYNYFVEHGVSAHQLRYDSFGKHEGTREHYQPDRKVVLHVEGASSDPNAPINPAK